MGHKLTYNNAVQTKHLMDNSSHFKDNKYTKLYVNIITQAQLESRKKTHKTDAEYVYYERHHVVPRCLGGRDDLSNLVLLTAKEHMICHLLLTKMAIGTQAERKLINAYYKMACVGPDHERVTPKLYKFIKERRAELGHSEETKAKMRDAWNRRDRIFSEEIRQRFREGRAKSSYNHRKPLSEEHKAKLRKPKSEEGRANIREALKQRGPMKEETKQKLRDINLGKKHTPESIQRMSSIKKGKPKSEETKSKMSEAALRRWHGTPKSE